MPNHSDGYFNQSNQACSNEPYLQSVTHLTVPYSYNKATPPPKTIVTIKGDIKASSNPDSVKGQDESDKKPESTENSGSERETETEVDLFNLEDSGKPRLIRVHDSDTEETDCEEETSESSSKPESNPKSEPAKPTRPIPVLVQVAEEIEDYTTPEPNSESDTGPASDSDKSREANIARSSESIRDESPSLSDVISESSSQTCFHRPLDDKYQPGTGKTIEDYVRLGAEGQRNEYTEETLLAIIRELEQEQKDKDETVKAFESGSTTRSGSVARSFSSKSA
jgi:hypothetical protein